MVARVGRARWTQPYGLDGVSVKSRATPREARRAAASPLPPLSGRDQAVVRISVAKGAETAARCDLTVPVLGDTNPTNREGAGAATRRAGPPPSRPQPIRFRRWFKGPI